MAARTVTIGSKVGLHARPAAIFSRAAGTAPMPVSIATAGNEPVPASSILSVMTLGAHYGDEVTLTADGDDAEAVLDELAALLASELDL